MASITKVPGGYRARWRTPDGRSRSKNFARKVDAERHLTAVEHTKLTGSYLDASAANVTLDVWWQRYQAETPKRPTTAARDKAVMTRWWLHYLGSRRIGSITPADVRAVVDAMSLKLAPATTRTNVGVFRAVIASAVEVDMLTRSPVRAIRLPAAQRQPPRFLKADELRRLAGEIPLDYRPMVYVAGILGLRWSEVAGLRVGRVDFLRRTVTVAETLAEVEGQLLPAAPKSKASARTLTAPSELVEMLSEHLRRVGRTAPSDLVFAAANGGPLRASTFRQRVWQPAVQRAGLQGFTFHGLRHSAVGFMIALGAHPRVIQRRAGHASIRTTFDVYGAVLPEVDEAVAAGLGDLISGPGESSRVISVSAPSLDSK
jgi:integrase